MKHTLLCLLAIITLTTSAQSNRSEWANQMLEAKHNMLVEEMGLTPTQKEQFLPMYEAMEKEIFQTNRDARATAAAVEKKANPTDNEYYQAAEALSNAKVKEGEIEAKYFDKFAKILSKRQLYQLKQAEAKFTRSMLKGRRPRK